MLKLQQNAAHAEFNRSFSPSDEYTRYIETILFMDDLLRHYSFQNVSPIQLIEDLVTGRCLPPQRRSGWFYHLVEVRMVSNEHGEHRQFLQEAYRIQLRPYLLLPYSQLPDEHFQVAILVLQQHLVELGIYLNGGCVDHVSIEEVYKNQVRYESLPETSATQGGFVGFNLCALHRVMLKFEYHYGLGILYEENSFQRYATTFLTKVLDSADSLTTTLYMRQWMHWVHSLLTKVQDLLGRHCAHTFSKYRTEDKNRMSFLAWELVLRQMDTIDKPFAQDWDRTLVTDIRLAIVKYHTATLI